MKTNLCFRKNVGLYNALVKSGLVEVKDARQFWLQCDNVESVKNAIVQLGEDYIKESYAEYNKDYNPYRITFINH